MHRMYQAEDIAMEIDWQAVRDERLRLAGALGEKARAEMLSGTRMGAVLCYYSAMSAAHEAFKVHPELRDDPVADVPEVK